MGCMMLMKVAFLSCEVTKSKLRCEATRVLIRGGLAWGRLPFLVSLCVCFSCVYHLYPYLRRICTCMCSVST